MDVITHLPGYRITEQIYIGHRTIVYRGVRESDGTSVVIKLLRNEYPNFNELVQFRNQYTIAKNLDFPNIVKPLTLESCHNSYALIMEDFSGISLSTYLTIANKNHNNKSLSLIEFLPLALQLTDILNYLYQNRVIHNDIKPANILINPDTKQLKLIDFSISSLLPRETQEIQNPNILEGTLAYLSPEQTGRMNRGIDYRSDFYSLGVTFYELLIGQLPFISHEAMELVHCHLAKQPIPLHEIKPEIPLVLSAIVSKLMAKNAEDRYQSALGLKHDLEICLSQLQETGDIQEFGLGQGDITDRFLIPEKLYAREIGVETGDLEFAALSTYIYVYHAYLAGNELSALEREITSYNQALAQVKQVNSLNFNQILHQAILNLTQQVEQPTKLSGNIYDEQMMLPLHQQANDATAIFYIYFNKLILSYLFEQFVEAVENAAAAETYLRGVTANFVVGVFYFYDSLTQLARLANASGSESSSIIEKIQSNVEKIQKWADSAPTNYQHKLDLISAEKYRIFGNKAEAIDFYDRAIAGAKENGYLNEEAIANELAAKFYLNWGKEKIAQVYMTEAYYCYARWGAKAKVTDLEQRYPQLFVPIVQQSGGAESLKETIALGTISSTKTSSSISEVLDLATLLKASQAISGEIELDRLLTTLLEIVMTNAGATKCILLLKQELDLKLVALVEQGISPQLLPSIPLELSSDVAISLVNTVKRTLKPLVLADAGINCQFAGDSYIQKHQPKSVFCSPILNKGLLIGVLYLENNLMVGSFTSDRVELLNLLCAQAAISLENAQLYRNSQNYAQQLTQSLTKLQATETRFQNLANNIPGMVYQFRLAADGSISTPYVSSGCLDLYEVEPELVMTGTYSLYTLHHPDDNLAIEKAIAYSAQNLTPFDQEWRIILPSGTVKWIQSTARPERLADGSILWDGVVIDISDRKNIEAEQTRLLAILESTPDLIGTADPTGKNLYLNRAWRHFLGLDNEAGAKGTEIHKYHPDWATEIIVNQGLPAAISSGIWVGETAVIDRNGREIPVSQLILSHKSMDGELEYFSTIIRDISDRKQAESAILQKSQELEQAVQALQQAQLHIVQSEKMSALGNLVAGVAHEMNNPLGFISASLKQAKPTLAELIEHLRLYQEILLIPNDKIIDHAEEIDLDYTLEDFPKVIDAMEIACDRLHNISTSLRTFSRADRDYKVPFNIHEGLDSTILILKHRLKANDRRPAIEVVTEYGNLPKIDCFPGQLNQVFINILANAIDALDESSIGRSFEEIQINLNQIKIKTSLVDNQVKISIADNGQGMTEVVKQKIFDHLFTTKAVGKGTGLGLAIARQIVVEKHSGSIQVNSILGEGTEFIITLPTRV
ncbi:MULTISPECIES: protein kinase domain-containing protein [Kamptonema]|uniref:protein kinase domain-containing protein n=1 Tax=Kamptonema TaxID=1501433 RepID=UPI0001DAC6D7